MTAIGSWDLTDTDPPSSGQTVLDAREVQIHTTDADANDATAALEAIRGGDFVTFTEAGGGRVTYMATGVAAVAAGVATVPAGLTYLTARELVVGDRLAVGVVARQVTPATLATLAQCKERVGLTDSSKDAEAQAVLDAVAARIGSQLQTFGDAWDAADVPPPVTEAVVTTFQEWWSKAVGSTTTDFGSLVLDETPPSGLGLPSWAIPNRAVELCGRYWSVGAV